jgi:hypothetical protein
MVNLVKYAAIAAFATGLGVATTKPASAWWGSWPPSDPNYGYGWGAFASGYPEVYGLTYPYGYGHVMTYPGGYTGYYRPYGPPYHRHFYGYYEYRPFYPRRRGGDTSGVTVH